MFAFSDLYVCCVHYATYIQIYKELSENMELHML